MRRAAAKLAAELPVGAIAVEYTGVLGRGGSGFRQLARVEKVPVSWNAAHTMHVWEKEGSCEGSEALLVG